MIQILTELSLSPEVFSYFGLIIVGLLCVLLFYFLKLSWGHLEWLTGKHFLHAVGDQSFWVLASAVAPDREVCKGYLRDIFSHLKRMWQVFSFVVF